MRLPVHALAFDLGRDRGPQWLQRAGGICVSDALREDVCHPGLERGTGGIPATVHAV